jgi:hypothetical protein
MRRLLDQSALETKTTAESHDEASESVQPFDAVQIDNHGEARLKRSAQ